ncbi:hypothetical protein DITRI_Ditri01bG0118600 [Diplodiscus trichospermus]
MNGIAMARAVLTLARKKNPQQPELWLAAILAESRHGYMKEEDILMALQECPNGGVAAEPKHGEKWQAVSKAVENHHQPTEAILKKVVVALGKEEAAVEKDSIH